MIREINMNDIPGRKTRYNNMLRSEIQDFIASDWTAAEIDLAKYKNAYTASRAYSIAARKMNAPVMVISRDGRAFLIRKDAAK